MKVYKGSSKTGQKLIGKSLTNLGYKLSDVYQSWSEEKQSAYNYCWYKYCSHNNAVGFRIISANTYQFSVAWDLIDPDTGEVIGINIETATNSYLIDLRY